jgi:leucyl/phenylalanyl-tRNA--protein transferase
MIRWLRPPFVDPWQPELADPSGLLAIGGDLRPDRLLAAYRAGVFPWYEEGDPVCWWSPDPRAIIELDKFHISRRLARTIRSGRFRVTTNRDFEGVIRGCSDRSEGTWITPAMMTAYVSLHRMGYAQSVEVWRGEELAAGLYGVAIGGFFAGESMFTRIRDASKVALAYAVNHLTACGFQLFDIQFRTAHTGGMGATEIPRSEYLERLSRAISQEVWFVSRAQKK